jgi:hypothetical protein
MMDFRKNVLANFKQYVDNKKKEEYENKLIIEENKKMLYEDLYQKRIGFYDKLNIKKFNMYIEFIFDLYGEDLTIEELIIMYNKV